MEKNAFSLPGFGSESKSLIMKLLPALGIGAGAGAVGYGLGSINRGGALEEQAELLNQVQSAATDEMQDQAFNAGVEFALSGGEGEEKQSFYREHAEKAFQEELQKLGFHFDLGKAGTGVFETMAGAAKASAESAVKAPFHAAIAAAHIPGSLKETSRGKIMSMLRGKPHTTALKEEVSNVARHAMTGAPVTIATLLAAKKLMNKESSLKKEAGPRFNLAVEALKGFKNMAKRDVVAVAKGGKTKDSLTSLSKNPVAIGGAAALAGGAGFALKKLLGKKPSAVEKLLSEFKGSAASIPDLLRKPSMKNFKKSGLALGTGAATLGLGATALSK